MAFGAVVLMPVNGDLIADDEIPVGYFGTTASSSAVLFLARKKFSMSLSSTPENNFKTKFTTVLIRNYYVRTCNARKHVVLLEARGFNFNGTI